MEKNKLYFDLLDQAIKETCEPAYGGYVFLPNDVGKAMARHKELCKENGICHRCGQKECNCHIAFEDCREAA